MAEEKSHVGLGTCFYCGEAKEILLDKRLRKSLPHSACYNTEPCDKCKGYMKLGIMLLSVRDGEESKDDPYRTGCMAVVREEALKDIIGNVKLFEDIKKRRMAFVPDSTWDALGLPRASINNIIGGN